MHSSRFTLPTHPRTGLRAVGIVNGKPVWPILGGAPDDPPAPPAPAPAPPAPAYKAPATQEEFDEIFERRLARERTKLVAQYSDYDDLKTKAQAHDKLQNDLASDQEKAVSAARAEERAASVPRVVKAEFRAAGKGVLTDEQLSALVEDLDLAKYANSKGEPDEEKIAKKIAAFAPAGGTGTPTPPRQLGQGTQPPAKSKPGEKGLAAAEKRFGKKQDA